MNYRRSKEYELAWQEAIKPYEYDSHVGLYRCALTNRVCYLKDLDKMHIFRAGTYPSLRCDSRNLLPALRFAHNVYDNVRPSVKEIVIDTILPGRWVELEQALIINEQW